MRRILSKDKVRLAALLLAGYLGSYVVLWGTREEALFALTDRGCFKSTREAPGLRSTRLERGPLRGFLHAVYRPVNAFRSPTEWKRE